MSFGLNELKPLKIKVFWLVGLTQTLVLFTISVRELKTTY